MKTGTVVSYNDQRGYGFIQVNNGGLTGTGKDLYVHASQLLNRSLELKRGDEVSFEVMNTARGLMASQVQVLRRGAGHGVAEVQPSHYPRRID
jgi:cold shock CspA family protein